MIAVYDDVLVDPMAYRAAVLARPFGTVTFPMEDVTFHGIQLAEDLTLPAWLVETMPGLTPTMSFFRQSPAGQAEPNYVHTDRDMGDWTAVLYLTPQPPRGDGTTFWRHVPTDRTHSVTDDRVALLDERRAWRDPAQWAPVTQVEAKFGRVVVFAADLFHSRSIAENYGAGDEARLVQVVFGIGALQGSETWQSEQA